jgi:hypothetical protein
MNRRSIALAAVVSFFAMSSALAQPEGVPPGPPSMPVEVTNTDTMPVPVTVENFAETEPQSIVEYRFVGLTTVTVNAKPEVAGFNGIPALHKLCQMEFGSNARAAFLEDTLRPLQVESAEFGVAWIISSSVDISPTASNMWGLFDTRRGSFLSFESTPEGASSAAACFHFDSSSTVQNRFAPTFNPQDGRTGFALCNVDLPIACSAPFAIPVSP